MVFVNIIEMYMNTLNLDIYIGMHVNPIYKSICVQSRNDAYILKYILKCKQILPQWRQLWPRGRVSPEVAANVSVADVWRHQDQR